MKTGMVFEWFINHIGEVLAMGGGAAAGLTAYAKLMFQVEQLQKQFSEAQKTIHDHASAAALHRSPDFEARINEFKNALDEIQRDIKQLLITLNHVQQNGGKQ